jgi:hypothetical protein
MAVFIFFSIRDATFNHETPALTHNYQNIVLETVDDAKANPLKHTQVHGGVGILKNQMACAFSGFNGLAFASSTVSNTMFW